MTSAYTFTTMPAVDISIYAKWTINSLHDHVQRKRRQRRRFDHPELRHRGHATDRPDEDGLYIRRMVFERGSHIGIHLHHDAGGEHHACTPSGRSTPIRSTFNVNGGSAVGSITQNYNTAVSAPADPTKTGYTFAGWYSDAGLTSAYTFTTMPAENITIYAKWTINSYTISFNSNGGSAVGSITQNYGTAVTQPADPTKTGYTFAGWYSDAGLTSSYTFTTMSAENITLYAKWTINSYTISFNVNGGSAVGSITQNYNTAVTQPTNPTKTGYTFAGWYSDAGLTSSYTFTTMPAENITLYAKWNINSYTLEFKDHDGTVLQTALFAYGASLAAVTAPADPTRTGYTFTGWSASIPATMPASDVTITAQYTINSYTLEFKDHDGTVLQSALFAYGASLAGGEAPADPTRTGYTFTGWSASIPATMPANDVTTTAQYTISSYTITLQLQRRISAVGSITQNYGYGGQRAGGSDGRQATRLAGWYSDAGSTSRLRVHHDARQQHRAVCEVDDQQLHDQLQRKRRMAAVTSITQNYATAVSAPADPTKTGYTFAGWYSDAGLTERLYVHHDAGGEHDAAREVDDQQSLHHHASIPTAAAPSVSITQNYGTAGHPTRPTRRRPATPSPDGTRMPGLTTAYTRSPRCRSAEHHAVCADDQLLHDQLQFQRRISNHIDHAELQYGRDATGRSDEDGLHLYQLVLGRGSHLGVYVHHDAGTEHDAVREVDDQQLYDQLNSNGGSAVTSITRTTIRRDATGRSDEDRIYVRWMVFRCGLHLGLYIHHDAGAEHHAVCQVDDQQLHDQLQFQRRQRGRLDHPELRYRGHATGGSDEDGLYVRRMVLGCRIDQCLYVHHDAGAEHHAVREVDDQLLHDQLQRKRRISSHVDHPELWNGGQRAGNPTKTGYTFAGWYSDAGLTSAYTFTTIAAQNITLYAKWTINSYTITFNSNGGSAIGSITQNYGTAVTQPARPDEDGLYVRRMVLEDAGLTSAYTFTTMPAEDITLYAKWTATNYVLEFRDYNGMLLQTGSYAFGSSLAAVTAPIPPTRSGYTFSGWSAPIPATMPANNVTITALYVINYVTITFVSNGGTAVAPITSREGMAITEPTPPTKTGFTFGGLVYRRRPHQQVHLHHHTTA
ncbi:MAG: InlB B-repeat-containing protein [Bacillus subtilis]|nr:InlB B-repeat-containing protein [Bacillus subtilis]